MKISKKAEYAMRAVLAIARCPHARPVQIGELSETETIPVKFLEQILLSLKKAGLLRSKRGAGGGYSLERQPGDITLGMILELIDGPFEPLGIDRDGGSSVSRNVGLERCFGELRQLVNEHLESHTIQDLLDMERSQDSMAFEI